MTTLNETRLTTLGRKIKTARTIAGLKQSELAKVCDVSRSAVSQWESDVTEPAASKLFVIARVTGQSLDWFAETTNAPVDFSTEAFGLSQHSVRSKGLEPPTFWLVVKGWFEQRRFDREFARITKGLGL